MSVKVRVWDLPTRIFHWALVFCVVSLVATAQIGGAAMDWHFRLGYCVLALLLFRLVWGVVGGRWSRFSAFLYSPVTLLRYLKGRAPPELSVGHNPLGAGSVFAMLLFLALQIASGLISDNEVSASGPLSSRVSNTWVEQATFYHSKVGQPVLYALLGLHVCAILFYLLRKRQNLIRPMLWGDKEVAQAVASSRDDWRSRALAALVLSVCVGLVLLMLRLAR